MTGEGGGTHITLGIPEAFHLAFQLHRTGQRDEAEGLYCQILEADPAHVDALHFLGVLCHQSGRNGEAEVLIRRILELQPHNADVHNNLGNVLQKQDRFPEAERAYRAAIELRPDHAAAHNNLAVVLSALHRYSEAVEAARRAVGLAPDAPDHHCNLANALRRAGQFHDAVGAYRQVLTLEPGHLRARYGLGRVLFLAGQREEAIEVFRKWLEEEPENPTLPHMVAALSGENVPGRASDTYVQSLFDGVSDTFDDHLSHLGYQAPGLVAECVAREYPEARGQLDVLDAGCGTGLCGPWLRPYAKKLVGVDLSGGMLRRAEALELYDDLVKAELGAYLGEVRESFDLIASADTLCYFGELDGVFLRFAEALRPGGVLLFTLEDACGNAGSQGFHLDPNGRYSHDRAYVLRTLASAGFTRLSAASSSLRLEEGRPVPGLVVSARRPG